ncbi:MAG TPA: hypothetical protein VGN83_14640 [Falsiroseomonas sp.]|nr:hypothetical protein [Falsiroseomonas sp.]
MQEQKQASAAVIALAGRRVDAPGTNPPRFPLGSVPLVRQRLAEVLAVEGGKVLVCSAACGADLLALEEAERLGLRHRVVLPFAPERFRETSVVDRPGDWGPAFDRLVAAADTAGDLVVLECGDGEAAYAAANEAIVREAQALAARAGDAPRRLVAVVVWEGAARDGSDATQGFRELAAEAGFEQRSVPTL